MNLPSEIICLKNGTLLEKYALRDYPHVTGSITTSVGIKPARGTALIWDEKLKKNMWQESGLPSWEDAQNKLWPAMLEYLKTIS